MVRALACTDVQLALLEGSASAALLEHAHACREGCRLVLELSGLLDAGSSASREGSEISLPKGKILDRYELEEVIGHGGQGVVCRARDLETEEVVAIKFLPLEHHEGKVLELKLARRVTHPNVCRVHDTQIDGCNRLIIMEHVAGPSLAAVREGLSRGEALRIFQGICAGVHAAHEAGVLHLDLTPSNVLLRGEKEPVVTDFGLSVALEDGARALGGTTGYMAPEQRRHERVDRRTDVYALGQLLRVLAGEKSRRLRRVIRRATHAEPERRYSTVEELARALGAPMRWRRALGIFGVVMMGGLAALLSVLVQAPPPGPRVEWHEELWRADLIPSTAWNVARRHGSHKAATAKFSHPLFACGNKPQDLFDGQASYYTWGRGIAFPPPPTVRSPEAFCVDLGLMGQCGTLYPDDVICEDIEGMNDPGVHGYRVLPVRGHDIDLTQLSRDQLNKMGKLVPRIACGERAIRIELDEAHSVFATRLWFYDPPPRAWRIEAEGPDGRVAVSSDEGSLRYTASDYKAMGLLPNWLYRTTDQIGYFFYNAVPLTIDFTVIHTDAIDIFFDTCTSIDMADFRRYEAGAIRENGHDYSPEVGWLYEIEIFAEVEWYQAWSWHLLGTGFAGPRR
jgi:tRNA A-37 threonylcarbamoyl transferase component Bud32